MVGRLSAYPLDRDTRDVGPDPAGACIVRACAERLVRATGISACVAAYAAHMFSPAERIDSVPCIYARCCGAHSDAVSCAPCAFAHVRSGPRRAAYGTSRPHVVRRCGSNRGSADARSQHVRTLGSCAIGCVQTMAIAADVCLPRRATERSGAYSRANHASFAHRRRGAHVGRHLAPRTGSGMALRPGPMRRADAGSFDHVARAHDANPLAAFTVRVACSA